MLQDIHNKVLEIALTEQSTGLKWTLTPHMAKECYNVFGELDDEDDLRAVYIPDLEGSHDIDALEIPFDKFKQPLKIKKGRSVLS